MRRRGRETTSRLFGQPGTQFDFAAQDPAQAEKRREQLQEASARLNKSVNTKVGQMLDRCVALPQHGRPMRMAPRLMAQAASVRASASPSSPLSVEKEEKALKEKLATVLNDKYKIEDTIKTLDVKKQEALHKTWEKVNGYATGCEMALNAYAGAGGGL